MSTAARSTPSGFWLSSTACRWLCLPVASPEGFAQQDARSIPNGAPNRGPLSCTRCPDDDRACRRRHQPQGAAATPTNESTEHRPGGRRERRNDLWGQAMQRAYKHKPPSLASPAGST